MYFLFKQKILDQNVLSGSETHFNYLRNLNFIKKDRNPKFFSFFQ